MDPDGDALATHEGIRDLQQNSRAVPCQKVPADRAPMKQVSQDRYPVLNNRVAFAPVNIRHKPDTAAVMLKTGIVESLAVWKSAQRPPIVVHVHFSESSREAKPSSKALDNVYRVAVALSAFKRRAEDPRHAESSE
jgi:hypothetical protein